MPQGFFSYLEDRLEDVNDGGAEVAMSHYETVGIVIKLDS